MLAKLTPFQISEHKLEGYIFKHHPELIAAGYENQYQKTWKRQWFLNEEKLAFLRELDQQKIKCTILKGMALLPNLYPDHGSRFISDIDILATKEKLIEIELFLASNDFTQVLEKKWMGNDYKITYKRDNLVIELHERLLFHTDFITNPIDCPLYTNIKVLPPEENYIYLCGHLALQHTFHKLYWLVDLHHFTTHFNLDWQKVKELSEKYQLIQSVHSVGWVLNHEFNHSNPLAKPRLLSTKLLARPCGWRYYILKHLLKDSILLAIWYDLFWFFSKMKKS